MDTILSQDPGGGEAEKGSTISVTVVGTQVADVPDVLGERRGAAEQELEGAGFEVRTDEAGEHLRGRGARHGPGPGGRGAGRDGSEVTITVGTGPSTVEVPNVTGNTPAQAAQILEETGLRLGSQSEDYSDEVAEGSIISQDPAEGRASSPASAVDVTVSLGTGAGRGPRGLRRRPSRRRRRARGQRGPQLDRLSRWRADEAAGTALSTEPPAWARCSTQGTTVTIYYSAGPPEPTASPEPTAARRRRDPARAAGPEPEDEQEDRSNADNGGEGNANDGSGTEARQRRLRQR